MFNSYIMHTLNFIYAWYYCTLNSFLVGAHMRSIVYTCCRDGKVRHNKQQRKTSVTRRMALSRKLGETFCLSRMTVTEDLATKEVTVAYIATHTNHQLSLKENKFLPLPQSVKKEVGEKFSKGVSIERIIDG